LIRVNYGFYVIERILLRSTNDQLKNELREEIFNNLSFIGTINLKNKWIDLLERSRLGLLVKASCERHDDDGHAAVH
jgi:hypothetical protein